MTSLVHCGASFKAIRTNHALKNEVALPLDWRANRQRTRNLPSTVLQIAKSRPEPSLHQPIPGGHAGELPHRSERAPEFIEPQAPDHTVRAGTRARCNAHQVKGSAASRCHHVEARPS